MYIHFLHSKEICQNLRYFELKFKTMGIVTIDTGAPSSKIFKPTDFSSYTNIILISSFIVSQRKVMDKRLTIFLKNFSKSENGFTDIKI